MKSARDFPFRLSLAAKHDQLAALSGWVRNIASQCRLPQHTAYAMDLVLTEAVTNVMDHAEVDPATQHIELGCACREGQIWLELQDDGIAFDPSNKPDPELPPSLEHATPGGLGIQLMRIYTSSMHYRREAGHNILTMSLPKPEGAAAPAATIASLDLSHIVLFSEIDDSHLQQIRGLGAFRYLDHGEQLLAAGQENQHIYALVRGQAEVRFKPEDTTPFRIIQAGEILGEMSVIDGGMASTYVYSDGPCIVFAIHQDVFWQNLAPLPGVMRNLTRLLTQRIRYATEHAIRSLTQRLELEQLEKELATAGDIQMGMLPNPPLFPTRGTIETFATLLPAKEVGGDLYDAFTVDDQHILLAVGDVSGKGMPAALYMMRTLTLLRAHTRMWTVEHGLLALLNRYLCENNEANMFVTLYAVVLDTHTGQAHLLNAGHAAPLLSRRGGPFQEITDASGTLLGIMPDAEFKSGSLWLEAGDRLLLYTDGVTEAENTQRKFFGLQRLLDTLNAADPHLDMAQLVDQVRLAVREFSHGAEQSDDITLVGLRYLG